MGFEQVVPPIPDRRQELDAIQRLEQSWINQPYNRYYMNESLRQPKMAFSNLLNKAYKECLFKTFLASIALMPLAVLSRRLFLRKGSFPVTFQADYFNKKRSDDFIRTWRYTKYVVPAHFFTAIVLGVHFTDWRDVLDQDYEFVHKTRKIM